MASLWMFGGAGNDVVSAAEATDPSYLSGGPGTDTVDGGDHNDVIIGGPGFDALDGGHGDDDCDRRPGRAGRELRDDQLTSSRPRRGWRGHPPQTAYC